MLRFSLLLTVLLVALPSRALPPTAALADQLATAAEADPDRRYALLVGIDDYPGVQEDLGSCVADVRLMRELLVERFGFPEENVLVLTDERATREAIIFAFRFHLQQAGPDGAAVFFYSGHGTRLPENIGLDDPESDGVDEALYVRTGAKGTTIILDDELGVLVRNLGTPRVLLALDACHSGTGTRGDLRSKFVASDEVGEDFVIPKAVTSLARSRDAVWTGNEATEPPAPDDHLLLAAASDSESAFTASGWPDRGGVASVFTYYLVSELDNATDRADFETVMNRVGIQTRRYAQSRGVQQTPQLEGLARGSSIGAYLGRR